MKKEGRRRRKERMKERKLVGEFGTCARSMLLLMCSEKNGRHKEQNPNNGCQRKP
jgi:hypothetical protein